MGWEDSPKRNLLYLIVFVNPLVSLDGVRLLRPAVRPRRTTTWRSSSLSATPWRARCPFPSACWTTRSVRQPWSMSWSSASSASTPPAWSLSCSSCTWCWTSSSSCPCSPWSSLARQVGGCGAGKRQAVPYVRKHDSPEILGPGTLWSSFLSMMWVQGRLSPILLFWHSLHVKKIVKIECLKS